MPIEKVENPKSKRPGQVMFTMWMGEQERKKWEEIQKAEGKSSLAKFVKEVMNTYIAQNEVKTARKIANGEVQAKLVELEKSIAQKFEDYKNLLPKAPTASMPEIAGHILSALKILGRPAKWEEIVTLIGRPKEDVLTTLEGLLKQKTITMNQQGDWCLNE